MQPDPILFRKSNLFKIVMMFVLSIYCFAASAQSATSVQSGKASYEGKSYANLAEFVQNNPSDAQSAKALKIAMILENPAAYPELTSEDLERLKSEQQGLVNRVNFINDQVKNGSSYEKASAMYQREADRKAALDNATNPNKVNSQPGTETAPAMINGNN